MQIPIQLYLMEMKQKTEKKHIVPPCRFFDRCILTGSALKLTLYDFSSNFNVTSIIFLIKRS